MLFLNPWLLIGLVGVLIPVVLHLMRRNTAKPKDWGAMRFLVDTLVARRKRIEWEDLLLMVTRCLMLGLLALALARPFSPPDSQIPWLFVLPLSLLGFAGFGGSFVLSWWKSRWIARGISLILIALAAAAIWFEEQLNLKRFHVSGRRDVALVIDGSTSMSLSRAGKTSFENSVEEARELVKNAPRGTAFSVILGGPAPEIKTASPLTHRADVLEVLDSLQPVGGPFRAHEALGMATLTLSEGAGASKDLVVFSDQQRLGWRLQSPASWEQLGEVWDAMDPSPRLLLRSQIAPERLRNIALGRIETSREVIGRDREVVIRIPVENTGNETVTPGQLSLRVDGKLIGEKGVGQLSAGESEWVEFRHRFDEAGTKVLNASLEGGDHLSGDNQIERVLWIKKSLPVVLVEGNPKGDFFDRAASYLGLALLPGEGSEDHLFLDPRVVDVVEIGSLDLSQASVIVLADIARLPKSEARQVADFVMQGGGLWVLSGPRNDTIFYNEWRGSDGLLMPATFAGMKISSEGMRIASGSISHPMLDLFRGKAGSDLSEGVFECYREVESVRRGAREVLSFESGEPFVISKNYGRGRVIFSAGGLDARTGNLPSRPSFVPFVHELTTWLAGGDEIELNVEATWSPSLSLSDGGGLRGEYFQRERRKVFERIDPVLSFDWKKEGPKGVSKDEFSIRWTGSLVVPMTGEYHFEATADDVAKLWLNDKKILSADNGVALSQGLKLESGSLVKIRVEYEERWGDANVSIRWKKPGGVLESIPSSVMIPLLAEGKDTVLGEERAIDPLGGIRKVEATQGRRGRSLVVKGTALPGAYSVGVPEALRAQFGNRKTIPVVVKRDSEESRFESLNEDDRALIRREIDFLEPTSVGDVVATLRGEGFGREIWKILILAALILFFLESLLARWVSKSRKVAQEIRVDFESHGDLSGGFVDALRRVKGGPS